MSTRSYIGYKDGDSVFFAYCHCDGYIEHNGVILNECYNTFNKVKKLVDKGDMSFLSPNIKGVKYYENEPSGKCNLEEYFKINIEDGIDFSYLYEEGKGWSVVDGFNRYNLNDYIEKHRDNEFIKNMKELLPMNYQTWDIKNKLIHSLYDETANVVEIFFFDTLVTNGDRYIHISIPVKDKNEALEVSEDICGKTIGRIIETYELESDYFSCNLNQFVYGHDIELWSYLAETMQEQRKGPFYSPDVKKENVDLTFNISAYKDECKVEYIYDNGARGYLPLTDEMKEVIFEFIEEEKANAPLKNDHEPKIEEGRDRSARYLMVDDRYQIYLDNGVVYDTVVAKDIPEYVFDIRDEAMGDAPKDFTIHDIDNEERYEDGNYNNNFTQLSWLQEEFEIKEN